MAPRKKKSRKSPLIDADDLHRFRHYLQNDSEMSDMAPFLKEDVLTAALIAADALIVNGGHVPRFVHAAKVIKDQIDVPGQSR